MPASEQIDTSIYDNERLLGTLTVSDDSPVALTCALTADQVNRAAWLLTAHLIWTHDRRDMFRMIRNSYRDLADTIADVVNYAQRTDEEDRERAIEIIDVLPAATWDVEAAAERASDLIAVLAPLTMQTPQLRLDELPAIHSACMAFCDAADKVSDVYSRLHRINVFCDADAMPLQNVRHAQGILTAQLQTLHDHLLPMIDNLNREPELS